MFYRAHLAMSGIQTHNVSSDKHRLLLVCSIFSFLCNVLYFFFLFFWSLYNVLSVLLRFTISDYPYDIFKLLLDNILTVNNPNFLAFVHQIYSMELRLNKANIFFPYRKFSFFWMVMFLWSQHMPWYGVYISRLIKLVHLYFIPYCITILCSILDSNSLMTNLFWSPMKTINFVGYMY